MKANESKMIFICFHLFFGIGTFQWVTADSNRKNSSPIQPNQPVQLITFASRGAFTRSVIRYHKILYCAINRTARRASGVGPRLDVGKAATAGLVLPCASHPRGAATSLSAVRTSVSSEAYNEAAVSRGWPGRARS